MLSLETLKEKISYQALLLAGFALLASTLLGLFNWTTQGEIELRLQEDLKALLQSVVPDAVYDNDLLANTTTVDSSQDKVGQDKTLVYLATKEGKPTAVAFSLIATGGYSGDIYLIMGVHVDGHVLGVRVISHAETPGLGDKIEFSKSDWITGFNQHSLDSLTSSQWAVKKDGGEFDQFTGATITPRAVVHGVYQGLQFFKQHKAALLAAQKQEP